MNGPGLAARSPRVFWLGILAFWIPICMIQMTVLRFSRPLQHALPLWFARSWGYLFIAGATVGLLIGTIALVVDAARNQQLTPISRTVWIAAILVVGPVIFPVYWWLHVLRRPKPA